MKIIEKRLTNKDKKIILSGPPGAGKTTIGKIFSQKIKVNFYDLDDYVSEKLGLNNSREVIEKFGHEYFREKESFYLEELLEKKEKIIISVGGGTNSRNDYKYVIKNQETIQKNCFNICILPSENIDEAIKILSSRLDNERRATVIDTKSLYDRWEVHTPILIEQSDIIVYTYNENPEKIIKGIVKKFFNKVVKKKLKD